MFDLSVEVWRFTELPPSSRDFKYRDQIRDSSDSAHRNVAEGFGRYNPTEFLRFLDIVKASADETRALLNKGHAVRYMSDDQFAALDRLSIRGLQALARLRRYLRSPEAKRNAERNRLRRSRHRPNAPNAPNATERLERPERPERSERSERPERIPNDPNDPNV